MDGEAIHHAKHLDALYNALGYKPEMKKAGILPGEFIWNEYTEGNPSPYAKCFQMHIVEYLAKESIAFLGKYGNQYQNWFDDHVKSVTENDILCVSCRIKSFCRIGMSSSEIPESLSAWLVGIIVDEQ